MSRVKVIDINYYQNMLSKIDQRTPSRYPSPNIRNWVPSLRKQLQGIPHFLDLQKQEKNDEAMKEWDIQETTASSVLDAEAVLPPSEFQMMPPANVKNPNTLGMIQVSQLDSRPFHYQETMRYFQLSIMEDVNMDDDNGFIQYLSDRLGLPTPTAWHQSYNGAAALKDYTHFQHCLNQREKTLCLGTNFFCPQAMEGRPQPPTCDHQFVTTQAQLQEPEFKIRSNHAQILIKSHGNKDISDQILDSWKDELMKKAYQPKEKCKTHQIVRKCNQFLQLEGQTEDPQLLSQVQRFQEMLLPGEYASMQIRFNQDSYQTCVKYGLPTTNMVVRAGGSCTGRDFKQFLEDDSLGLDFIRLAPFIQGLPFNMNDRGQSQVFSQTIQTEYSERCLQMHDYALLHRIKRGFLPLDTFSYSDRPREFLWSVGF
ncbi:hypothetical protein FGO68_gene15954 [Halteria grandinella]|uniref:Uncharacterized protein n=1 Tax=Halteria grandinella TaxID=5974 RepID=A0A8J8T0Y3_HALGN|nr:hypothetical protein FGO68_gene15954 [Halteria grandinella]